jgi:hypothetical protein
MPGDDPFYNRTPDVNALRLNISTHKLSWVLEVLRQGSTPEQDRAGRDDDAGENASGGQGFAK